MKKLTNRLFFLWLVRWSIYIMSQIKPITMRWDIFFAENAIGKTIAAILSSGEVPWRYLVQIYEVFYAVFGKPISIVLVVLVTLETVIRSFRSNTDLRKFIDLFFDFFRRPFPKDIQRIYVRYIDSDQIEGCVDIQIKKHIVLPKSGICLTYFPKERTVYASTQGRKIMLDEKWQTLNGVKFRTVEYNEFTMSRKAKRL